MIPTIHYQSVTFMQEMDVINPRKPGMKYFHLGNTIETNITIVVEGGTGGQGGARFYCKTHRAIYMPLLQCPYCAGLQVAQQQNGAGVTTCNTP